MTRRGCGTTMWWVEVAVLWWTHGGKQVYGTTQCTCRSRGFKCMGMMLLDRYIRTYKYLHVYKNRRFFSRYPYTVYSTVCVEE